ncbi:MAG: F0F1 ATP synthase subunit alpha [candidate division WOR-3 bacterium]|nr:F0F1 ATP synthase subunit alpha [candidate division WOR-3 bacterium]
MKTDDVLRLIRSQLDDYKTTLKVDEVGYVLTIGDGIARIFGLDQAMVGELLEFPGNVFGIALNLDRDSVGAAVLGDYSRIRENDQVKRTGRVFQVPVGDGLLGRVVDPLGKPLDDKGAVHSDKFRPIEAPAPGVIDRQPVEESLHTGIKAVDAMIPIGRGQRELIIGDRQTGKTAIGIDAIIAQRGGDVACIYVAIGQKQSGVARTIEKLAAFGALEHTIVVSATANDSAPLQYIAPYAGCAMAEELAAQGRDVLIVYDDLSKHAVAYRQLSLLLRRPPGREAYPGDVFYLHSRLLERAAKLSDERGGGSITALPIIETQAGDISAYIPTNVISITDGQIYLESGLFYAGVRPAINVGLSVSRVGGAAQLKAMRKVAGRLRIDLAQYRELSAFAQFGADLDEGSRRQLLRGEKLVEAQKQDESKPLAPDKEMLIIYAGINGLLDDVPTEKIKAFEKALFDYYDRDFALLGAKLLDPKTGDQALPELEKVVTSFKQTSSPDAWH